MQSPKVAMGCPVRNRAWVIRDYLGALINLEWDNKVLIFLENDSTDETALFLQHFCHGEPDRVLKQVFTGVAGWDHGEYSANEYANLADLRNQFLQMFLETDADFLFSVDSDVILPPDALLRLMEHADENTIVAAAISNIPGRPLDGRVAVNFMIRHPDTAMEAMVFRHPTDYPLTGLIDVDVTGAVYLIPRKAIKAGVQYGQHPQGEDIPFCIAARELGFQLKVLLDLQCEHRMDRS